MEHSFESSNILNVHESVVIIEIIDAWFIHFWFLSSHKKLKLAHYYIYCTLKMQSAKKRKVHFFNSKDELKYIFSVIFAWQFKLSLIIWFNILLWINRFVSINIEATFCNLFCKKHYIEITFHWSTIKRQNYIEPFYSILSWAHSFSIFCHIIYASKHYMKVAFLNYIYILKSNCFLQDGGSTDKKSYVKLFLLCQSLLTYDSRFHTNTPNILFPIKLI